MNSCKIEYYRFRTHFLAVSDVETKNGTFAWFVWFASGTKNPVSTHFLTAWPLGLNTRIRVYGTWSSSLHSRVLHLGESLMSDPVHQCHSIQVQATEYSVWMDRHFTIASNSTTILPKNLVSHPRTLISNVNHMCDIIVQLPTSPTMAIPSRSHSGESC